MPLFEVLEDVRVSVWSCSHHRAPRPFLFFCIDPATPAIYTLSLPDALPLLSSALAPLAAGLLHSMTGAWTAALVMTLLLGAAQITIGLSAARPGTVTR